MEQNNEPSWCLKSLKLSYKIDELNQIKSIFPQNQLYDLIIDKLKLVMQLQYVIKSFELD